MVKWRSVLAAKLVEATSTAALRADYPAVIVCLCSERDTNRSQCGTPPSLRGLHRIGVGEVPTTLSAALEEVIEQQLAICCGLH